MYFCNLQRHGDSEHNQSSRLERLCKTLISVQFWNKDKHIIEVGKHIKRMRLVKPKKALGQHFLKDLQIAERIADTLKEYVGTPVLEIGPGMGVLTQFLLEAQHDLKVVELDQESVEYLEQNFPDLRGRIIAKDFLKLDPNYMTGLFASLEIIHTIYPAKYSLRFLTIKTKFHAVRA